MRVYTFTMAGDMSMGSGAMTAGGVVSLRSSSGRQDTMNRLDAEVKARGMTVFACSGRAAGAASVGLPLKPTILRETSKMIEEASHDPRL